MAGLEEKIEGVAERILAAAKTGSEQGNLSVAAVSFAYDAHAQLTKGIQPRKMLTREYVLYLLMAGMDEAALGSSLDAFLIGRVSGLRRSSRTLDSIKTIMTAFGERDFYGSMLGFSKEHVQEESSVGERGKCFVCPEKPNALLLLKDQDTGQLFTMGFDCYKTLLTTLIPDKGSKEYVLLEDYVQRAERSIAETEPFAKSLSVREKQRLHEFDEFIVGLQDTAVRAAAVKDAEKLLKEHDGNYRELDAKFWREIGRLMEKAGTLHDVTIATSIAEPGRGWFGMLDTLVSEGAGKLVRELVGEQKVALYTPSLGKRLILYNEVMSRMTGGWRNIAGDIVEEIYHERTLDALSPAQMRVYSGVGLFQRIEAFMHGSGRDRTADRTIFSEDHRIPYRDLIAIMAVYESGVKEKRLSKNRETVAEFEGKGLDIVGSLESLDALAKARILPNETPSVIRDLGLPKWALYSHHHLTYGDHDFVRMLQKRWTLGIPNQEKEVIVSNAVSLEPSYRFREIMERLESIVETVYPVDDALKRRMDCAARSVDNPYLFIESKVKNRLHRMRELSVMTPKGEETIEVAENIVSRLTAELASDKRSLHYSLPGVDITVPAVQDKLAAYRAQEGKTVAFLVNGIAVVHKIGIADISSKEYIDARVVSAVADGFSDAVPVREVMENDLLQKARYLGKTSASLFRFAKGNISSAPDLASLTEDAFVSRKLVDAVHAGYAAVVAGEKEVLRVVRSEHRQLYLDVVDQVRVGHHLKSLRVVTSGKVDDAGKKYLSQLGFTLTQKGSMMKRQEYAHNLAGLLVGIAEYNVQKNPRERLQVWLFEN